MTVTTATVVTLTQARIYESRQNYQEALQRAIAPLTEEQMSLRLVSGMRSVRETAAHTVYARALWLHRILDDSALEPLLTWATPNDPMAPPRPCTAAEVLHGLDQTWRIITACLDRWMAAGLHDTLPDATLPTEEITRLRTIWGLLEHDLHHGGELSFQLGAHGLAAVDL
ncbi:MAG: DinB family protein [Chloroflexota bacterium]|nr:DinB family protein [Chloroflexota bacterium]